MTTPDHEKWMDEFSAESQNDRDLENMSEEEIGKIVPDREEDDAALKLESDRITEHND